MACSNWLKPVWSSLVCMTLDFDIGGHVIQIEQTKALCDSYLSMLVHIIEYRSQRSVPDIYEADSCV